MEQIDNLYEEKDFLRKQLRFTSLYSEEYPKILNRYNAVCDEIYRYEQKLS